MRLEIQCTHCGKINKAPRYETNRTDYAKRFGAEFDLRCRKCGFIGKYKVDDIKAHIQLLRSVVEKVVWITLLIYAIVVSIGFLPFSLYFAQDLLKVTFDGIRRNREKEKSSLFNRNWFRTKYSIQIRNKWSRRVED